MGSNVDRSAPAPNLSEPMVVTPHGDFLWHRVKRLHMLTAQRLNEILKPYGLARSQWQVMARVRGAGDLSQRELQAAMQVEPATLTGIIDTLVTKGWIERRESEQDKRCRVPHLTAAGLEKMQSIPDPHEIIEREMTGEMSPTERTRADKALQKMIRNLEERG
jgi:DNA-binding MarR family transcriptional regulator